MRPHFHGRRHKLDPPKKREICALVAQGASVEEAAYAVGVSLRTVQRARKWDEQLDHELRLSQQTTPDPLKIMQSAARTHWRAAAWLLEREDPERYARRPPTSCSPVHFDQALELVVEAALEAVKPQERSEVFKRLKDACERAFQCAFPAYGPWGKPRRRSFPAAPLIEEERRKEACDPRRILADLLCADDVTRRPLEPTTAPNPRRLSPALQASLDKHCPQDADPPVSSAPPSPSRHEANGVLHQKPRRQQVNPATTGGQRQLGDSATSSVATTNPSCREKCTSRQNAPPAADGPAAAPSTTSAPTGSTDQLILQR
jgi:hypothetical protein